MNLEILSLPPDVAAKHRLERLASLSGARRLGAAKAELRFDSDHRYLKVDRSEFETEDDLLTYVAGLLPTSPHGAGLRGRMKRVGKYQRVDRHGEPVFTFGDPILDMITDERGILRVGRRRFNLYATELARPDRGGGLSCVDFSNSVDHIRLAHLSAGLVGGGPFCVIECEGDKVTIASRDPNRLLSPDKIWHYDGNTKMRFRAFKRSYLVYTKIGADIETWGHDFKAASIHSRYGQFLDDLGHCFMVDDDDDSDTNDDYVDEYEWFAGANTPSAYDGVESSCVATWHGRTYSDVVGKGCIVVDI